MSSFLYRIIVATTSLHYNHITACICQPHYHTHGTLLSDCLKTRIAMKPPDQIDEACRSNVGQDLSDVQSISMVITQLFANCKRAVECHLTYLMFYIAKELLNII